MLSVKGKFLAICAPSVWDGAMPLDGLRDAGRPSGYFGAGALGGAKVVTTSRRWNFHRPCSRTSASS